MSLINWVNRYDWPVYCWGEFRGLFDAGPRYPLDYPGIK